MNTDYHLREFLNKTLKRKQKGNCHEIKSSDSSEKSYDIEKKKHNLARIYFDSNKKRKFKKMIHSSDSDSSDTSGEQNSNRHMSGLKE